MRLHAAHIHWSIAFPMVILLALSVAVFTLNIGIETDAANTAAALALYVPNPAPPPRHLRDFTSIDVMKLTKDVVANQPSPAEIDDIVSALAQLRVRYIAISVPLDPTADYPAGHRPAPQTAEAFTQTWADAIHNRGMLVLWRGTWLGIEGIYSHPKLVGARRFPAGTAESAAFDGNSTWLGKTYQYIVSHPDFFRDGDIWAPLPERTENIFQDNTSFLAHGGAGIQSNYAAFFNGLKKTSDAAFAAIGKNAYTGWSSNNFTEAQSDWLQDSIYRAAGIVAIDYYGSSHTPEEMERDLLAIHKKTRRQIFVQEWADYWDRSLPAAARERYLRSMYAALQDLADRGVVMGFNYWGGWPGAVESILIKTPSGYALNGRGLLLAEFFGRNSL